MVGKSRLMINSDMGSPEDINQLGKSHFGLDKIGMDFLVSRRLSTCQPL